MNLTRTPLRFQPQVGATLPAAGDAAPNHSVEGFAAVQGRGLLTRRDCREVGKTEVGYRDVAGLSFGALRSRGSS